MSTSVLEDDNFMLIDIITLFPKMFSGPLTESMISRAQKRGLVKIKIHQLRDWAINSHGQIDDRPYGGGAGMVMRVDVAFNALKKIAGIDRRGLVNQTPINRPYIILPTPSGKKFDQALARKLAKKKHLVFLCPHYEGYDYRIESLVDEKISIGDYVLTGGELPTAVIVDAVVRLVPGVINKESLKEESFSQISKSKIIMSNKISNDKGQKVRNYNLDIRHFSLEYPQYTRPEVFEVVIKGKKTKKRVPKVLLSGNHALIAKWRGKIAK